jgi:hypothetical protein
MHVYHNCFYTTFTAAIPLMVNIGFDGRRRQSRHFPGPISETNSPTTLAFPP